MAGRPRKTTTAAPSTEAVTAENAVLVEEVKPDVQSSDIEVLRKENDELKKMLSDLMEKLSATPAVSTESKEETSNYADINPLRPIKVISLSDGGVSLRTTPNGHGKSFRFDKFGHALSIAYSDLQDIIATDRGFIEKGVVYICDEDVVRNNYLEDHYRKFLTMETIRNILSFSINQIADMVSGTTVPIQETIVSQVVDKINRNEYVDMNKVLVIGNSCKTPCDIMALAMSKRNG